MNYRHIILAGSVGIGMAAGARADVKVSPLFSEHMVLQQGQNAPVWGTAAPGEKVAVRFAGQEQNVVAAPDGKWMVRLRKLKASSEGRPLTITGADAARPITLSDVLVGEVWVCSGQSNMAWNVAASANPKEEMAAANHPGIRMFTVGGNVATTPQANCSGRWAVCSPETVSSFSAVAYFFGRDLHTARNVPIGLINTSVGGTVAEAWTSAGALRAKMPEFTADLDRMQSTSEQERAASYQKAVAAFETARTKLFDIEEDLAAAARRAQPDLDDSAWKTMTAPGAWEGQGLPGLDGMVWYRKAIDIPAAWAGKDVMLRPGPIDEVEVTWFNGEQVGGRGNSRKHEGEVWDKPRDYRVPGRLVKAGRNVVAIRVTDMLGQGGLVGAPSNEMYATLADDAAAPHISLAGDWRYEVEVTLPPAPADPRSANQPSVLFNGMVNPLMPYGMRGVIWYQGESNADRAKQYQRLLPTLIADWRSQWGNGDFPFLVVQLANYMGRSEFPQESAWATLREAQSMTAATTPKSGLAVTIDIGEAGDIHPRNKQDVGKRLALAARKIAYGERIEESGPVFEKLRVQGGKVRVKFRHTGGGLVVKGDKLEGFSVAGADGKYAFADARLEGNEVVLTCAAVPQPTKIRYAWADNPAATLYNGAGLPAVPFRSDAPAMAK